MKYLCHTSPESALQLLEGPRMKFLDGWEFERRRNLVLERLRDMGIKCNQPQGAFYVFPSIENPEKLVLEALKKDVVLVPGNSFGKYGDRHFRISYAASYQDLEKAMDRLESLDL